MAQEDVAAEGASAANAERQTLGEKSWTKKSPLIGERA
jgi:hypothetical protein